MVFGKLLQFGKRAAPDTFKAKYVKPERPDSVYPIRDKDDPEIGHYPMALLNVRPGMTHDEVNATLRQGMPGVRMDWVFDMDYLGLAFTYSKHDPTVLTSIHYRTENLRGPVTIEGIQLPVSFEQAKAAIEDWRVNEAQLASDTHTARGKYVPQPVYVTSVGNYDAELSFHKGMLSSIALYARNTQAEREAASRKYLVDAKARDELIAQKVDWKTERDPDRMLSKWADSTTAPGAETAPVHWFCSRLKSATPDEWHSVAEEWNWDQDIAPLYWIVKQPQCDMATALTIFFLACPEDPANDFASPKGLSQQPSEAYDIAVEIRNRWVDGFYRRSEIAFDKSESDYVKDLSQLPNPFIHPSMCLGLPGRTVKPPYSFFRDCPHLESRFVHSSFSTAVLQRA
jgi:Domain of unknown function (DUF4274)